MANTFDNRKSCIPFERSSTLVAVIEQSKDSWLVGGILPGLKRNPAKKLNTKEKGEEELLKLLLRWRQINDLSNPRKGAYSTVERLITLTGRCNMIRASTPFHW